MMQIIPWRLLPEYFYRRIYHRMSVIVVLLIASISVASLFLFAFLWSVKTGQYDDDQSPASRILFDDKPLPGNGTEETI